MKQEQKIESLKWCIGEFQQQTIGTGGRSSRICWISKRASTECSFRVPFATVGRFQLENDATIDVWEDFDIHQHCRIKQQPAFCSKHWSHFVESWFIRFQHQEIGCGRGSRSFCSKCWSICVDGDKRSMRKVCSEYIIWSWSRHGDQKLEFKQVPIQEANQCVDEAPREKISLCDNWKMRKSFRENCAKYCQNIAERSELLLFVWFLDNVTILNQRSFLERPTFSVNFWLFCVSKQCFLRFWIATWHTASKGVSGNVFERLISIYDSFPHCGRGVPHREMRRTNLD